MGNSKDSANEVRGLVRIFFAVATANGAVVASLFLLAACSRTTANHPRAEYIVRPPDVPIRSMRNSLEDAPAVLASLEGVRNLETIATIGANPSTRAEILGQLAGAAIGPQDRVYAVDSRFNDIRVFTPAGKPIEIAAGPGHAPGQLLDPRSLIIDRHNYRLYISDVNHLIHVYSLRNKRIRYVRSINLGTEDSSPFCVLGDRIVIADRELDINSPIRVYSLATELLYQLDNFYDSPNRLVNYVVKESILACDAEAALVLVGTTVLGEVRAFDPDGHPRWLSIPPQFSAQRIYEELDGPTPGAVLASPEPHHRLVSVTFLEPRLALVQVAHVSTDDAPSAGVLYSFAVSADTGEGWYIGKHLPLVTDASKDYILSIKRDSASQLVVFRRGGTAP